MPPFKRQAPKNQTPNKPFGAWRLPFGAYYLFMSASCARCAGTIPHEQIERDEAVRFQGMVFCPICAEKLKMVHAAACPRCGGRDLPLFDGTTMLCRHCGADLPARVARADLPHPHAAAPKAAPPDGAPAMGTGPSFNRRLAAAAGGLFAVGASLLLLWHLLKDDPARGQTPPTPDTSAPVADGRIDQFSRRMETLKTDIAAARAEWDAAIRRIEDGRLREEGLATEARRALAARLDALSEQFNTLQRRSEEIEKRVSSQASSRGAAAPAVPENPDDALARRLWQEIQVRRASLLESRQLAAALSELLGFPEPLANTPSGREVARLAEWERKNILKNLYPVEKDRAEAHAVKGEIPQAVQAYRDMEKRLGIPEILPEIRTRLTELDALRKARPPAGKAPAPPLAEGEPAAWLEEFRSIAKASAASEKFLAAGKPGADALLAGLNHASADIRRHSAMTLAKARDPRAVEAILAKLSDPDPWNRQVYITALGEIGDPVAAPALIGKLEGADGQEARAAHESLERLSGKKASIPFSDTPSDRGALVLFWRGWLDSTQKK